jgi:hypothetical protein
MTAPSKRAIRVVAPSCCPIWHKSGHGDGDYECPLSGVKRSKNESMSAYDPKRTSRISSGQVPNLLWE